MPRVLITGATGFIGRHLTRTLVERNHAVHVLVRPESDCTILPDAITRHCYTGGAEAMRAIVQAAAPDITFHLASVFRAEHQPDDIPSLIGVNLELGVQLVDALTAFGHGRLVNAGTVWQHYSGDHYDPVCLYAATKQAFEALLTFYVQARGLKVVVLKLPDSYGPDDPRRKLIWLLLHAARTGVRLALSPGQQRIDLLHVSDIVEAFIRAGDMLRQGQVGGLESYTVSSGHPITLRHLAEVVERVTGRSIDITWGARPYRHREVMTPWRGGTRLPGWQPTVALDAGIRHIEESDV